MNLREMIPAPRLAKGIYWSRAWSLVEGCTPVAAACDHCWAAAAAHVRRNNPSPKIRAANAAITTPEGAYNGTVRVREDLLSLPARTRKPQVWNVWTDLFHQSVPDDFLDQAFSVMEMSSRHVFIVCTKRPERLASYICFRYGWQFPPRNIIGMTTAENQDAADVRIPLLLRARLALRAVSVEPMLGPVNLQSALCTPHSAISWVICGGESGPRARAMAPGWARSLRDQCQAAGVPFFFKHWGEWQYGCWYYEQDDDLRERHLEAPHVVLCGWSCSRPYQWCAPSHGQPATDCEIWHHVGHALAGRLLDEMEWDEMPEVKP